MCLGWPTEQQPILLRVDHEMDRFAEALEHFGQHRFGFAGRLMLQFIRAIDFRLVRNGGMARKQHSCGKEYESDLPSERHWRTEAIELSTCANWVRAKGIQGKHLAMGERVVAGLLRSSDARQEVQFDQDQLSSSLPTDLSH